MVQYFPPPGCRSLLPPLLACLPTAFVSPKPPPALLPLLTPILRQRIQLLAATASPSDSWLPLLCWETDPGQKLVDIVSDSDAFELHPVSGEIDYGDVEAVRYRRLDEETLQARMVLIDLGLLLIYLWCDGDQEGGGNGWRVSEVRPLEGEIENSTIDWSPSISMADEGASERMMNDALRHGEENSIKQGSTNGIPVMQEQQDDDEDYWASYDKSPGPGAKSVARPTYERTRTTSEDEYFARYSEVQPEMDNDDPSEDHEQFREPTLDGNRIVPATRQTVESATYGPHSNTDPLDNSANPTFDPDLHQPTASSPVIRPNTLVQLEEHASSRSMTEIAIGHHVSTTMKSLYRLCRSSGIDSEEFHRMIHNEMETLSMMEDD